MGLTELVAVASNPPASAGASSSPEAYISLHDIHSFSQSSVLKKSSCPPHCLALSPSHVFAAQSDKSVLNVYNRSKGNLETTVPLPEQLSAVASSHNGGVVAMGTTSGRVNIWETSSGRYTSTPLSHLQKITTVTFDPTSTFLLTGSDDTNILVWSIPHLTAPNSKKQPLRTLEYHQQPIISILCGQGSGPAAIAVSASKDNSCIVWNYQDGTLLRTFSLFSTPTSLALDPADRGFYVGFGDGTIQQVEFAKVGNRTVDLGVNGSDTTSPPQDTTVTGNSDPDRSYDSPLYRSDEKHIPIAASSSGGRWTAEGQESSVTAMDVVFEGNYLVAGTESGAVNVWDVATGHLFRALASYKAPISCVKILPPIGFAEDAVSTVQQIVVPPRYHDAVKASSHNSVDVDTALPPMALQFNGTLPSGIAADPFSPAADLAAIAKGIAYFNSPAFTADTAQSNTVMMTESIKNVEDAEKITALEKELEAMKERYKRLNEVHKQTWEEHTKWVMDVDKDKAEKMMSRKAEEGDEMQTGE
ncbi:hypothetical protein H072_9605 [Dactylellina haptotyla CBS 200.50]|uniref:Pre-rRNA-processing protein IPI3 n=1 Tax=Dactylellina haptotyla (strain CBS 200.50) TaxID=1284197 RepID=S8BNJ3_DACHA|nr:hypothetical protein H072_9605 [Dactylellina haptotyla CBS 200.50]